VDHPKEVGLFDTDEIEDDEERILEDDKEGLCGKYYF